MGLVNRLFDDRGALMYGAMAIARQLAHGPRALALVRRAYSKSAGNSFEQQIDLEARLPRQAARSQDCKEGVAAFLGKRAASFRGR